MTAGQEGNSWVSDKEHELWLRYCWKLVENPRSRCDLCTLAVQLTPPNTHAQKHTCPQAHKSTLSPSLLKAAVRHSELQTHTHTLSLAKRYLTLQKYACTQHWQGEARHNTSFHYIHFHRTRRQAGDSRKSFRLQWFCLF